MDRRLRELERRAKSGDPQAEQALLRERVVIRDLRRKKLRLAAYLGHEPAESAHAEYLRKKDQRFDKWIRGLRHHGGPEAAVRVALCGAELLLPAWNEVYPDENRPGRAVAEARAALLAQSEAAADAAVLSAARITTLIASHEGEGRDSSLRGVRVRRALRAAACASRAAVLSARLYAKTFDATFSWQYEEAVRLAVGGVGERALQARIKRDLLAWALA